MRKFILMLLLAGSILAQTAVEYRIRMAESTYTAQLRGASGRTSGITINGVYNSTFRAHEFSVLYEGYYELWFDINGGTTYTLDSDWSGDNGKFIQTGYYLEFGDTDQDYLVDQVDENAIGSSQLQNNAVTAGKIANNAVSGLNIIDETVGTVDIGDSTVTIPKISTALYNLISSGGSITNNPDDETLHNVGAGNFGLLIRKTRDDSSALARLTGVNKFASIDEFVPGSGTGGGDFTHTTASGYSPDGGTTILADDGGHWVRDEFLADSGVVNVKWFGATGDGVTNDSLATAKALQAASHIYLPGGTYRTHIVQVSPGTWIEGAGASNDEQILGLHTTKIVPTRDGSIGIQGVKGKSGLRISDLYLEGRNSSLDYGHIAIYADRQGDVTIENVVIRYWFNSSLQPDYGIIADSTFRLDTYDVDISATDIGYYQSRGQATTLYGGSITNCYKYSMWLRSTQHFSSISQDIEASSLLNGDTLIFIDGGTSSFINLYSEGPPTPRAMPDSLNDIASNRPFALVNTTASRGRLDIVSPALMTTNSLFTVSNDGPASFDINIFGGIAGYDSAVVDNQINDRVNIENVSLSNAGIGTVPRTFKNYDIVEYSARIAEGLETSVLSAMYFEKGLRMKGKGMFTELYGPGLTKDNNDIVFNDTTQTMLLSGALEDRVNWSGDPDTVDIIINNEWPHEAPQSISATWGEALIFYGRVAAGFATILKVTFAWQGIGNTDGSMRSVTVDTLFTRAGSGYENIEFVSASVDSFAFRVIPDLAGGSSTYSCRVLLQDAHNVEVDSSYAERR